MPVFKQKGRPPPGILGVVMTQIVLENVGVSFPLYDLQRKGLMVTLIKKYMVGGKIQQREDSKVPVVTALDGINLNLQEGDKLAIRGHNGSGKTTLLRTILGSYKPTTGMVSTAGAIVSMVGINLGFDADATGYQNIFIRGAIMGFKKKQIMPYVDEIVSFCELDDFLHLPVRTYSSGMTMRLAFAIATTLPADIVLLDEWLSVGDTAFSEKAEARLQAFLKRAKILVLATHNHELASHICNRFVTMEAGRLVE